MKLPCLGSDITSAVFSKSTSEAPYDRLKIKQTVENSFFVEYFKGTQVFQATWKLSEVQSFFEGYAGTSYHVVTIETQSVTYTLLTSRKGKTTLLKKNKATVNKPSKPNPLAGLASPVTNHNRVKNYLLPEGKPVPFLIKLGVMTKDGKIHTQKYDKFRQINRFLEFVDDIMPELEDGLKEPDERPFHIIDFGCGKSYLTFALYHYLTEIKNCKAEIFGLDLKKDVIANCSRLATDCGYTGLHFSSGDIAEYRAAESGSTAAPLDLVITLHACDTATDYALAFAVEHGARAILSVPCCQHELNTALGKKAPEEALDALLKYGIIKERFSALATDVLRAEQLTAVGYKTQILEFIDMEHTPKNLLIRAVRQTEPATSATQTIRTTDTAEKLLAALGTELTLERLLKGNLR